MKTQTPLDEKITWKYGNIKWKKEEHVAQAIKEAKKEIIKNVLCYDESRDLMERETKKVFAKHFGALAGEEKK